MYEAREAFAHELFFILAPEWGHSRLCILEPCSGKTTPSIEVAAKLAKALNISLDYLSELTDIELNEILLDRIQKITSLPGSEQEHIFKVVDALIKDALIKDA